MKRQKIYFVAACLFAILSILTIVHKKGVFKKSQSAAKLSEIFAVKDTSVITKIFMADMYQNNVLLTKTKDGWMVNQQRPASEYKVKSLLNTLNTVRVSHIVAKNAQQSTISVLAITSTKVEVYSTDPLFSIFGIPFFTKERLLKIYYLGDATQNSLGSYALLEGMQEPYVIYKPGFRGYVTPQFSPKSVDWYSPRKFETKLTRIQNASFVDMENPENTFFVEKSGPRTFSLFDYQKKIVNDYDTILLVNMLSEFRDRNYEQLLHNISTEKKDSILQSNYFRIISLTDIDNKTFTMKLFHLIYTTSLYDSDDNLLDDNYQNLSRDRCYAIFNDNMDEIFTVQYYHFDRQLQPISYFLK
jgi:hypothetical protein